MTPDIEVNPMGITSSDVNAYARWDATELAERIRRGELSCREAVELAFAAIAAKNPELNAFAYLREEALREADECDGTGTANGPASRKDEPFLGVPVGLKNLIQELAGEPHTMGSRALRGVRAPFTSRFAEALREAGFLVIGITNVPEFALMGTTEPKAYGPTRNPWDVRHSPGGSSGGSAAAVAARMVPLAGANDGGGSIRIPAAYTGLFGLKPTRGRTPIGPGRGRALFGLGINHVLTRSVRDSAAVLDVLWAKVRPYEPGAAFVAPPFDGSYREAAKGGLSGQKKPLRVAVWTRSPLGGEPHPAVAQSARAVAEALANQGHAVEEAYPQVDGERLTLSYLTAYLADVAHLYTRRLPALVRTFRPEETEAASRLLARLGERLKAADFLDAVELWDRATLAVDEFFAHYDLLVTPTAMDAAPRLGEGGSRAQDLLLELVARFRLEGLVERLGAFTRIFLEAIGRVPFTQLANFTGTPTASVPVGRKDGLPVGVQLMAGRGREDLILAVARFLEETPLWLRDVPPHAVGGTAAETSQHSPRGKIPRLPPDESRRGEEDGGPPRT
ncbi:MAG: Aspartyl-tRNA(Asn) amidotransferase subunit A [Brockia lithotrophica]|uniref:Aspartyl-tRNA(Asn) amidotransferase subunit A n=1 Tax=Brockia lithotrophica TaxID=933949 RepID=A0A2T5G935_9BACL|nr:MAG: Aspartyl-tRNA(Asn) amidotransferase subunit A [Brockia lithotrophica]